jgi:hypothetical protein
MAKTIFSLTGDTDQTFFSSESKAGPNRYSDASLLSSATNNVWQYPLENDNFNVPFLQFKFLDAFGFSFVDAPIINLQMPNQFNVSSFSEYAKTDNIFGSTNEMLRTENNYAYGKALQEEGFNKDLIATVGLSGAEAVQAGIARALGGIVGFIASGGMNNIGQFEFLQKQAVNPFSQLLYKGPQHRKYQIPLIMRPRSANEANHIKKIIHTFRVASSPSLPNKAGFFKDTDLKIGDTPFTFGYPDLTKFDIVFHGKQQNTKIFRSKPCVIDSVAVDYGGQKLTFFEDGNITETQLTIQLTEITPRTLGDARTEAQMHDLTII